VDRNQKNPTLLFACDSKIKSQLPFGSDQPLDIVVGHFPTGVL
jgi:hypothetical protein